VCLHGSLHWIICLFHRLSSALMCYSSSCGVSRWRSNARLYTSAAVRNTSCSRQSFSWCNVLVAVNTYDHTNTASADDCRQLSAQSWSSCWTDLFYRTFDDDYTRSTARCLSRFYSGLVYRSVLLALYCLLLFNLVVDFWWNCRLFCKDLPSDVLNCVFAKVSCKIVSPLTAVINIPVSVL